MEGAALAGPEGAALRDGEFVEVEKLFIYATDRVPALAGDIGGVQRPLVRVSSIELLDSTNQPTGIEIPYGSPIDVRVLGTFSNRAAGKNVESFQGEVIAGPAPLLTFQDLNVDFVAQGVLPDLEAMDVIAITRRSC